MKDPRINRRQVLKGVGAIGGAIGMAGALGSPTVVFADDASGATLVRWDIQSLDLSTSPPTQRPGGVAFASADPDLKIKLTGTGTFVSPASGGTTGAATGGGTWETFEGGASTGSGTYQVTGLVSWQFANLQVTPPPFIDAIGNLAQRTNGNAVLRIAYSDGSRGVLGLGCEGPGAPEGIQEGVIATKHYFTYWTREAPLAGVDKNRTLFHILRASG